MKKKNVKMAFFTATRINFHGFNQLFKITIHKSRKLHFQTVQFYRKLNSTQAALVSFPNSVKNFK